MDLAADPTRDLGQPPLDRHVDVLVAAGEREIPELELGRDAVEPVEQRGELVVVEDPGRPQRPGVGPRLPHVVGGQAPVEAQRGVELPEDGVGFLLEAGHWRSL